MIRSGEVAREKSKRLHSLYNVRKGRNSEDLELNDIGDVNSCWLKDARYDIIFSFTHPESAQILPKYCSMLPKTCLHAV